MSKTNRSARADQIAITLRFAGYKATARDDHGWHTVFAFDAFTGAEMADVQVFDSGRFIVRGAYSAQIQVAIGA
jgi:hypothetical protein